MTKLHGVGFVWLDSVSESDMSSLHARRAGEAENSTQGCGKFHPGFWKIPPRVRGPPRLLENPSQGFGKVLGHNSDLVIEK